MPLLDLGVFVCVLLGAEALYITCKLQNCTDANKAKPFPGYIDPNSLVVQDEYVFVQVCNRPLYSRKIIVKNSYSDCKSTFSCSFINVISY